MNNLMSVVDQMAAAGLPVLPAGHPKVDGKIHRFGKDKRAWYVLHDMTLKNGKNIIVGTFGVWQGTDNNAIKVEVDWSGISKEEKEAFRKKQEEADKREAQKKAERAKFAANRAIQQWKAVPDDAPVSSPYLARKQVTSEKTKTLPDGTLYIPMCHYDDNGTPHIAGLQKIAPDGTKRFNSGMAKIGACLILGDIPPSPELIIVGEGYATVASVMMALERKYPAAVAFDCGNLMPVAKDLRRRYPKAHILIAADDDFKLELRYQERMAADFRIDPPPLDGVERTFKSKDGKTVTIKAGIAKDTFGDDYIVAETFRDGHARSMTFINAGIHHAREVVRAIGNASMVWPRFKERSIKKPLTDFNDLHTAEGLDAVKDQIKAAVDAALTDTINKALPKQVAIPNAPKTTQKIEEKPATFWNNFNRLLSDFTLIYGANDVYDSREHMMMTKDAAGFAFGEAFRKWREHPQRKTVKLSDVVFDPSCSADPETTVNLFHGWQMQPAEGSCENIIELAGFLCGIDNGSKNASLVLDWLLKWIAYPLQNPGVKMRTSIIMHGDEGSGKNLFWEDVVRKIYGEYGGVIGSEQLEGQFNEWASKKLFIVADEVVTRAELRQTKGRLKKMITGTTLQINPKNVSSREEANHMNLVFLSNEIQPLVIDATDRRYLVIWTPQKREKDFYNAVSQEIKNGGIEAFYKYLMDLDLTGFNQYSDPPLTKAKNDLISMGLPAAARFFNEWSQGEIPLPFISCTVEQAYAAFTRWGTLNGEPSAKWTSKNTFSREFMRAAESKVQKRVMRYDVGAKVKQGMVYLIGDPGDTPPREFVSSASALFDSYLSDYRNYYPGKADADGGV